MGMASYRQQREGVAAAKAKVPRSAAAMGVKVMLKGLSAG